MNNTHNTCIIGIDPGSTYMGVGEMWIDPIDFSIGSIKTHTLYGAKYHKINHINDMYGATQSMLFGHRKKLYELFSQCKPIAVFCESPFYNRRMPSAFGSLTRTLEYIKQAVIAYDPHTLFKTVDPPTAKKAVGASGASSDKAAILKAIEKLEFYNRIQFQDMTEHEVDAVAIAYWGYKNNILNSQIDQ